MPDGWTSCSCLFIAQIHPEQQSIPFADLRPGYNQKEDSFLATPFFLRPYALAGCTHALCFVSRAHGSFLMGCWMAIWRVRIDPPPKVRSSYPINRGLCPPAPAAGPCSPLRAPLPVWDSATQAPLKAVIMCQVSEGCTLFA